MLVQKWIVIIIIFLHSNTTISQPQHYFRSKDSIRLSVNKEEYISTIIGAKDGLPSSEILALYQDSKGFIWIGTSGGVSRYDGNSFENFISAGNKQLGKINNIVEDTLHKIIWIMSDAGLSYYNNGFLHRINFDDGEATVYDMDISPQKIYWFATAKGPASYNNNEIYQIIETGKADITSHVLRGWKNSLKEDSLIRLIKADDKGKPWFASKNTLYNSDDSNISKIWYSPAYNDMINAIVPVEDKIYFVSTLEGILVHSGKNKISPVTFRKTISANIYSTENVFYYMCLDGIFKFSPEDHTFSFLCKIPGESATWLSCMLVDREKNIWIGLHDALFLQRKKLFYEYRSNKVSIEMYCGAIKKDGTVLFGGHRGKVYEKKDDLLVNYLGREKSICSRSSMSAIYEDTRGWIWYGSAYQGIGVQQFDSVRLIKKADGLGCNQSYFFLETSNGDLWTGGDGFLTRIKTERGNKNISFSVFSSQLNGDNWFVFLNGIEGPGNRIWTVGERGIFNCDGKTLNQYPLAGGGAVGLSDIKKGDANEVWVTTEGDGIWQCYFDDKGLLQLKKKYSIQEGLHTNSFLSLLIDEQRNIWAISYSGLAKISFQQQNYFIRNYTAGNGFPDKNYQNAKLLEDSDKRIWIITPAGLSFFEPAALEESDKKPLIVWNNTTAGDSTYYTITSGNYPLVLKYDENEISFRFSGIYFTNPSAIKYFYRLSGSDSAWKNNGSNRTINFEGLRPGNYILETKAVVGNNQSEAPSTYHFIIKPPFWQTWWFYTVCTAIISAGIYVWVKQKEKNIQKAAAKKNEIQKHIAELEIKALKSQMNPHFVFNSLNSIAHLIASKQNEKGIEYLTKFSKLLRIILDESENNFVVLKDEIKMLDLYLQIEAMRFGDTFSYNIHIDDNIDEDDLSVPALLLHPIVENAVWHGLLHKQGERRLIIHFKKINNNILQCTVKDNGIGIEAAKAMKEKRLNGIAQKSKGLQLVKDRLKMLEQQFGKPASFSIEDIHSDNYSISGTIATIQFPVLYES